MYKHLALLSILLISLNSYSNGFGGNSLGGKYSSQVSASVARVDDETSSFTNPAGLGKINNESISSGASSYSALKAQQAKDSDVTTSSSTSHVAYIQSLNNYNIGWLVYTIGNEEKLNRESQRYNNSEGYDSYSYASSKESSEANIYILGISPKESKWGMAFNLYDINFQYTSSRGEHTYQKTDYIKRRWTSTYSEMQFKMKLISLSFGYQGKYKNINFGLKIETPTYILSNDSHQTYNFLAVSPYLQNDSYVYATNVDSKLEVEGKTFMPESITLGLAYINKKFQYEFNLFIKAASVSHELNTEDDMMSYNWTSLTDTYNTEAIVDDDDGSYEYLKAQLIPSFGIQYNSTEKEQYGLGFKYIKSTNKDDSGTNTVNISTGYAKKYKNFLGSYSIIYTKDFDTGQNTIYDYEKGKQVKTNLSKDSLSLTFGGSYFF